MFREKIWQTTSLITAIFANAQMVLSGVAMKTGCVTVCKGWKWVACHSYTAGRITESLFHKRWFIFIMSEIIIDTIVPFSL